jgi:NADH-quinone oxidoreductase subunit A
LAGGEDVLDNWLPFLIYALFAALIPISMVVMSFVFATRPKRRTRARGIPFESGVSTGPLRRQRFTIVFLYPLGVVLHQLAWFGFAELAFFLLILLIAYVYVWRKGALEWQ